MQLSKKLQKVLSAKNLKILFVASESAPFAKAGGLGDIMYSLPLALRKLGQDARLMIPRYGTINPEEYNLKMEIAGLKIPTDQPGDNPFLICNVKKYSGSKSVPSYFLENMEYYEQRANVYGYSDDHIRWVLLCRGVIEFIRHSSWVPDIIVASDWQTGLLPNYIKTTYKNDPIVSKIPVLFCVHNMRYQGMCDFRFSQESDKDSGRESIPDFFNPRLAKINWLMRGILYGDSIVVVSPNYAKEILTPEYGEGLDKILVEKQHKIFGILNGISYAKYNPQTSPHISSHYNIRIIRKRRENKIQLQKRMGLAQNPDIFMAGMVSRLTDQKGFDLLENILEPLFKNLNMQMVILGDGDSRYKEMIQKAKEKFPEKISYHFEFDIALPHIIFAGADVILVPSKFEPCGIVQMQSMRFGCIPIVRGTGGLADTVEDFNAQEKKGDGFVFKEYDPWALFTNIVRAYTAFGFKADWKAAIKRAMRKDFSWKKSARKYLEVLCEIVEDKNC